jgi:hypothetical protein
MATHLTRGDLKRNELGEAVEAGFHFAEHHLRAILYGVAGLLGLALVVWGVFAWRGGRAERANEALGAALSVAGAEVVDTGARPEDPQRPTFATASARDARARELFERAAAEHDGTAAGAAAHLWLAEQAVVAGDRAAAESHWRAYLEDAPDGLLAAATQRNLWDAARTDGRAEQALVEIRRALERRDAVLPVDALLWELALTHRSLERGDDERAALSRIVEEHPGSPFAGAARERLEELGAAA